MEVILKQEAKALGLKFYFTGKSCKRGHVQQRNTISGICCACEKERQITYWEQNRNKIIASRASYSEDRKEKHRELSRRWRKENPDKLKAAVQSWRDRNPEKLSSHGRTYRKNNRNKIKERTAIRRAFLKNALPPWADTTKIKQIYKNCPLGMHVDHIVPLQNSLVCGLHVENNLQYLTPKENLEKGNKYDPIT